MTDQKTLVMISSSLNPDLLHTPRKMGLKVVLVAAAPPRDPAAFDCHLPVDELDEDAVLDAVLGYIAEHGEVHAVATFHEGSLHVAARLAKELGLPGNSPEAARAMRDKFLTGRILAEAGVGTPVTLLATTLDQARAAARQLGYPLVVKPQSGASSQGVIKVRDDAELDAAFTLVNDLYRVREFTDGQFSAPNLGHIFFYPNLRGVLVQEYVTGEEVAIDLVYGDGVFEALAIHDKPVPFAEHHFFETTYVTPSVLPQAVQRDVVDTAVNALRALGATVGAAHVELRVTDAGPKIIEVNGRLGGTTAYVQESIRESTGVWGPLEYLRAVLGERPRGPQGRRGHAGFTPLMAERTGRIERFEGVEEVERMPGVIGIRWMSRPGDHLVVKYPENPASYFALVLARGEDRAEVLRALREAERVLRPVYC
ncbi:ATP-grasp domain-containing protein [Solihabitans fulvus]|uniref:ATP-grasp domain-containing protein n=1 Tax=Solihabitans fulvus TaxID=1892852 RepID=A0A5B2XBS8_9PSEU|nr:ATP-grasp domain-containing protein [Solihabitans fulvus]KAA2261097.1 ATP-grasp domain-containing protein [Solihabitans fulvus]